MLKRGRWAAAQCGVALVGAAAVLAAAGCALGSGSQAAEADAAQPQGARSGLAFEADQLLNADRAFAEESLQLGAPEAFSRYFDEQGIHLGPSGPPAVGPGQVRARLAEGPANILSWEPRFAEVFAPGHWGWTWGDWQLHEPGAGGRRLAQGRYVNVWKKQPDGSWKVRLDLGNVEREPQ